MKECRVQEALERGRCPSPSPSRPPTQRSWKGLPCSEALGHHSPQPHPSSSGSAHGPEPWLACLDATPSPALRTWAVLPPWSFDFLIHMWGEAQPSPEK